MKVPFAAEGKIQGNFLPQLGGRLKSFAGSLPLQIQLVEAEKSS